MSTKLKLSNALASGSLKALEELLTNRPLSLDSAIARSRAIVSLWSSADLELLDPVIMPFRAIESQLDGVSEGNYDVPAATKESVELFASAAEQMAQYIQTVIDEYS